MRNVILVIVGALAALAAAARAQEFETFVLEPNRPNVVARLKGRGKRPLLLMGHTDVVPVNREGWSRDPFGAEIVEPARRGLEALDPAADGAVATPRPAQAQGAFRAKVRPGSERRCDNTQGSGALRN